MHGDYGTAQVIGKDEVTQELVLGADQVLVGTNRTRRRYNQRLRELKGFNASYPQAGDKLVCLRNDHGQGPAQRLAVAGDDVVARDGEAGHQPAGLARETTIRTAAPPRSSCSRRPSRSPDAEIPWQQKQALRRFRLSAMR